MTYNYPAPLAAVLNNPLEFIFTLGVVCILLALVNRVVRG